MGEMLKDNLRQKSFLTDDPTYTGKEALEKLSLRPMDVKDTPPDIIFVYKIKPGDLEDDKGNRVLEKTWTKARNGDNVNIYRGGRGWECKNSHPLIPSAVMSVRREAGLKGE